MSRDARALALYEKLVDLPADQRLSVLDQACGDDGELRAHVESLLAAEERAERFIDVSSGVSGVWQQRGAMASEISSNDLGASVEPVGAVLAERYRVNERIGSGGMGDVYRATDLKLEREVAVKWLSQTLRLSNAMRRRFEREVKSVAALSHTNIVTLYDLTEHEGVSLAVMEYVQGETLRAYAESGLNLRDALGIVRDIAAGLGAAHERGLIHRDIKPENVMVISKPGNASSVAKVLDFGLARREDSDESSSLTQIHQTPGTPPYMSPEQVLSNDIGCATDIFSLGTVLFELVTGENPFRAPSALETMQRIGQQDIPVLNEFYPAVPSSLNVLLTGMHKSRPELRPKALEVVNQLEELLAGSGLDQPLADKAIAKDQTAVQPKMSSLPLDPIPTNLPRRGVELIGRNTELADLAARLHSSRVLTVLGTGGAGKTSLAFEAARRSAERFTGGVWLCELAPLRGGSGEPALLEVLAGALDGNAGTISTFEEVVKKLDGAPTLLIVDNCEHVIDAAAKLIDHLSQQLPELSILLTSREALQISGESIVRIEGLQPSAAAELFLNRASDQAGIQDDSSLEDRVDQVVRRLEGLPLAIELAAPKLGVMSLGELIEGLDHQSQTLRTGRRSTGRQSAIDQTIAWSFDLLDPEEQTCLLMLSVLNTWFTPEAAAAVCGLGPPARAHLLRLAEQSVVVRKEDRGQSRYRLLEPIRQYCQSRIGIEELASARERHARYFAERIINKLSLGISGYDEMACLHALDIEWPDLREAVAWGREHRIAEVAVDPCVALTRTAFWQLRVEALQWLIAAEMSLPEAIARNASALVAIAWGHWLMSRRKEMDVYLKRLRDVEPTPLSLWSLTYITCQLDEATREEEREIWDRFVRAADASGDEVEMRWVSQVIPVHPHVSGEYKRETDEVIVTTERPHNTFEWHFADAGYVACLFLLEMEKGKVPEARRAALRCIDLSQHCGARFLEVSFRSIYQGLVAGAEVESGVDLLYEAIQNCREALDAGATFLLPVSVRSLIAALVSMDQTEAAARGCGLVANLVGVGVRNQFNPEYNAVEIKLRSTLTDTVFEELCKQGRRLSVPELLEIAETLAGEASRIEHSSPDPDFLPTKPDSSQKQVD